LLAAVFLWLGAPRSASAAPPDACAWLEKAIDAQRSGPAFLPSYPTAQLPALKGTAFLYDNAVAAIALVGCGQRARASRIGDAILAALNRDRHWHDGRLRNAYPAGSVGSGAVKLAGYWDKKSGRWMEDAYQVGSDNGNMAWAILALLALDQPKGDRRYRDAAVRIGTWVTRWRSRREPGGFTGGTFGEEPNPKVEAWRSTEHNADLAAAFAGLAASTGDGKWIVQARIAEQFVRAMWNANGRFFDAGVIEDGVTRDRHLALDAQTFPLLAWPGSRKRYGSAVATLERRVRVGGGFAFGNVKGGIWTEGTEQVALLLELSGREADARSTIKAAQNMRAPDGSYFATDATQLPTGLPLDTDQSQSRRYFHLAHLAPAAWAALAERRFDPFAAEKQIAIDGR
jgi:hypothetical protein